jgi:hypothetical protein
MNKAAHDKIASFSWGIADDVLSDLFKRGKYLAVVGLHSRGLGVEARGMSGECYGLIS